MVIQNDDFIIPFKRAREFLNGIISITLYNLLLFEFIFPKLFFYHIFLLFVCN